MGSYYESLKVNNKNIKRSKLNSLCCHDVLL